MFISCLFFTVSTVFSEDDSDSGNDIEISVSINCCLLFQFLAKTSYNVWYVILLQTAETVESIVGQLMEKQRLARQAALVKQLECGCADGNCGDGKSCTHPMRRTGSLKGPTVQQKRFDNGVQNGQNVGPRVSVSLLFFGSWVAHYADVLLLSLFESN